MQYKAHQGVTKKDVAVFAAVCAESAERHRMCTLVSFQKPTSWRVFESTLFLHEPTSPTLPTGTAVETTF